MPPKPNREADILVCIGLGNPGPRYEETPHNAGFLCIDALCRHFSISLDRSGEGVLFHHSRIAGEDVVLAKPQTYMNRSGMAVQALLREIDFEFQDMLIIYDDIDLPLGSIRIRGKGGAGTHRGMQSVSETIGCESFPRLRIGIQPPPGQPADIVEYVLSALPELDWRERFLDGIRRAAEAVVEIIGSGLSIAMNKYNRRTYSLLPEIGGLQP